MIVPGGPRLRSQRPVGGCALPIRPRLLHGCEFPGVRPRQRRSRVISSALSSSWRYLAGLSGAKWAGDQPAEEAFADGLAQELAAPSISAQPAPSASAEGSSVLSRSVMATWADTRHQDHADLEDWVHKSSYEVENSLEMLTGKLLERVAKLASVRFMPSRQIVVEPTHPGVDLIRRVPCSPESNHQLVPLLISNSQRGSCSCFP